MYSLCYSYSSYNFYEYCYSLKSDYVDYVINSQ